MVYKGRRQDLDGTPKQLREMYVSSEMSSTSLHKPYIVAEGHAMIIMHIRYRTIVVGGRKIQKDMVWQRFI